VRCVAVARVLAGGRHTRAGAGDLRAHGRARSPDELSCALLLLRAGARRHRGDLPLRRAAHTGPRPAHHLDRRHLAPTRGGGDRHARERGLTLFFDFYPYTTWSSSVHRARFEGDWLARYRIGWARVRVAGRDGP